MSFIDDYRRKMEAQIRVGQNVTIMLAFIAVNSAVKLGIWEEWMKTKE